MNIVIVGGGFAGVKSALELKNKPDVQVTLISKGSDFEYHGALYRSATGQSPLEVVIRLGDIFKDAKNIEIVIDKITKIDETQNTVKGETGRQYIYDHLVIAMGNEKNYFGIEGLDRFAHTMYTIHDTIALRHALVDLFTLPHRRKVRVVVVGAGPSGVELAAELKHFSELVAERYGRATPMEVEVDLIEGADRVLPILSQKVSAKAGRRLEKLGVRLMLCKKVMKCSQNSIRCEDCEVAGDIIVWTAGSKTVSFYADNPLVFQLERGKVIVDEYLRPKGQYNIYVLGDNAFTHYSGMAQTAIFDGGFVGRNLLRLQKKEQPHHYKPKAPVYVVPIGKKWAIYQKGDTVKSGYTGWLVRRRADLEIFKNFQPFKTAIKTWRKGNNLARF